MKIIVTVKIVPEKIVLDKETGKVVREGIKSIFNPLDLLACEEGIKLKEKRGGELIALSMAPPQEKVLLNELFKYGFDRVLLLTDKAFAGSDTLATAFILSEAIKKIVPDFGIILQGDYSLDGATGQLGGELAAFLNIPFITQAVSIKLDESLYVERLTDETTQKYKTNLPALVSVRRGINNGIVTNLFALDEMHERAVEIYTNKELGLLGEKIGNKGSKTNVLNVFQEETEQVNTLVKENGATAIVDFLKKVGVV